MGGMGWGMNRFNANRYSGGQASGALGGGTLGEARQKRPGMGSFMSRGGSSRFGIEPSVKREKDGDIIMGASGARPMVKRENGNVSSDDDFDTTEGPRMNIEHINLISDEEEEEEDEPEKPTQHRPKRLGRDTKVNLSGLKPVRIDRHEHVERSVGVNTEASSTTMADHRRKAKERALAEGGLFLSDDEAGKGKTSKPKGKGKDVQFVKDERRWQGVYPEDEDILNIPMIKEEPKDDVEAMAIDDVLPTASSLPTNTETTPEPKSPKAFRKAEDPPLFRRKRPRCKGHAKAVRPVLQTTEDRQEWARYEEDLYLLSEELGFLKTSPSVSPEGSTNAEEEGAEVDAESKTETKKDRKQGLVYLFQLPPIIPPLATPVEKEEGEEAATAAAKKPCPPPAKPEQKPAPSSMPPPSNPFSAAHKTDPKIKPDPDSESNLNPTSSTDVSLGKAGKLTVFASGSVKATWGGVGMEVGRGGDGGILQEVVLWEVGIQGAQAMGQVAGGFVGVPQWGEMIK